MGGGSIGTEGERGGGRERERERATERERVHRCACMRVCVWLLYTTPLAVTLTKVCRHVGSLQMARP